MTSLLRLAVFLVAASPLHSFASSFPAVLTDNATGDEPAIETGVQYSAEPPFTNPADTTGRRLLDRDLPCADWNTCVGSNSAGQTVTFDFQRTYQFTKFALLFRHPEKPAKVECSVADSPDGPWSSVGTLTPQDGWNELKPAASVSGRYVRMSFQIKEWGWYLSEVKIWGERADGPGADAKLPLIREGKQLVLVQDGQPSASIIVAANASPAIIKNARFLQKTIEQMSGALLPLRDDSSDSGAAQILVGNSLLNPAAIEGPDAYRIVVQDRRVALSGDKEGIGYAVFDFLENLGCGWFGPDPLYHVVPSQRTIRVTDGDRTEKPAMTMRDLWNKPGDFGVAWRVGKRIVESGHAYSSILPQDTYWDAHPEYYAMIAGKRSLKGQICLSNPEVQRLAIEYVRAFFQKNPDASGCSLSPNDSGGFCECDECKKLGGTISEQTLAFANIVAREIAKSNPGKYVAMLAYWYTFPAPTNGMKAEPNVIVVVVNQGCHAHALEDPLCKSNEAWRRNFEGWEATGAKLGVWEWYIPGYAQLFWRQLPWVSADVAFRNLRYWHAHGVRWMVNESEYESGTGYPRRWPLYWMAARGMWNPNDDPNELMLAACQRLYGPAGETMAEYFRVMDQTMEQTQTHGALWNLPLAESIYRPKVTAKLRQLLARAAKQSASDTKAWQRVSSEMALWAESEQTLSSLPTRKQHEVDARDFGGVWFTEKEKLTGAELRELVGIGPGDPVTVSEAQDDAKPLVDKQSYNAAGGLVLSR